ncbi:outer membrane beta-barrel protein [Mucilaginibacter sp. CSA2-8R]|uniref:outer membrane beta-barrel protein n=1 Tax=Mucilaginibacter sp. CSA2-8R TaxID=3141542 RepID=UPI00315CBE49
MKFNLPLIAVILFALLSASTAKAQLLGNNERYAQYVSHVNVGLEGLYTMNPGHQIYTGGVGFSIKYQYDVTQNLGVTGGTGYYILPAKNQSGNPVQRADFKMIPLRVGAKAYFLPEAYFGGELGVAYVDPYVNPLKQSHFAKTLAPSIGYETNHLDVSFRYENVNHSGDYVSFITLRAAYIFNF